MPTVRVSTGFLARVSTIEALPASSFATYTVAPSGLATIPSGSVPPGNRRTFAEPERPMSSISAIAATAPGRVVFWLVRATKSRPCDHTMPRGREPTATVPTVRSVLASMMVTVPDRSLVTNTRGERPQPAPRRRTTSSPAARPRPLTSAPASAAPVG